MVVYVSLSNQQFQTIKTMSDKNHPRFFKTLHIINRFCPKKLTTTVSVTHWNNHKTVVIFSPLQSCHLPSLQSPQCGSMPLSSFRLSSSLRSSRVDPLRMVLLHQTDQTCAATKQHQFSVIKTTLWLKHNLKQDHSKHNRLKCNQTELISSFIHNQTITFFQFQKHYSIIYTG